MTDTLPYIPCVHFSQGLNTPISRIVIHGTVSPTVTGQARRTAAYFQNPTSGGSAQIVVDPGEAVRCAQDTTICWHAPPNRGSLGVEFCDWVNWKQGSKTVADLDPFWKGKTEADFAKRWSLYEWDQMLRRGAKIVAGLAQTHGVPLTRIGVADLLAGKEGLCGHIDVAKAWHQTDHTDGSDSNFPWATFLKYVAAAAGPAPVTPAPAPRPAPRPVPRPGVLAVDGGLGPATITAWQKVMGTPVDGRISANSSLVVAVQRALNAKVRAGLVVDGKGISLVQDGHTRTKTISALQRYLSTGSDGVLSTPSSTTIKALQRRLNTGRF